MMIGAIFEPKKFYLHIACLHLQLDAWYDLIGYIVAALATTLAQ